MRKKVWRIVKRWAKTGRIDLFDVMDVAILLAEKRKQAPDMPTQAITYNNKNKLKRKDFSPTVKKLTLRRQAYRCNMCKEVLDEINFDHIDGNRSNNSITNCQALCPNCHAKKSRKKRKRI